MRTVGNVIHCAHYLGISDTAQCYLALTVLHWFARVEFDQLPIGFRGLTERLHDPIESFGFIELSGNGEHGIVWLVVVLIKACSRSMGTPSMSDRKPITLRWYAWPGRRSTSCARIRRAGTVFATFKLVAHHGHFAV